MTERSFGTRSGLRVPRVNIGGMRLPEDIDEAAGLIRYAIDAGMRYIDTSRGYGNSELKFARALKGGYRKKVILSTKWSPWAMRIEPSDNASADCVRRRIDEQMRRLDVDYLDFYQIWSINDAETYKQTVARNGILAGIRKAMDEGLVKHTGFTTHDDPDRLVGYLGKVDWCEVILVTYNLLNTSYAPVLAAAHERGIGTIVMNPVGGGKLAHSSEALLELAREVGAQSVPELAIRYVLSNPNVDTIIPGISKTADVDDSIAAAEAGPFSHAQLAKIQRFIDRVSRDASRFCTACGYCMPCPHGVKIPEVMGCIQDARFWGLTGAARQRYQSLREGSADGCEECGECEPKCTQKLQIIDEMRYAKGALSSR